MEDFKIINNYPTKHIKLTSGKWSKKINNKSVETVPAQKATMLFSPGSFVEIFIRNKQTPGYTFLTKYRINRPISEIHVGQVTTRLSGGMGNQGLIGASSAVQGHPFLNIHNPTMVPLRLNNNILVKPNSILAYTGRYHSGVPLGLVLKDVDGLYPRLQLTKPVTDIYYGIVSDTPQPIYGGWQKIWTTDVDYSNYYDAYGHVISL